MIFIWATLQTPLKMYKQQLHFEIKSKYFRLKGVSNLQRGKQIAVLLTKFHIKTKQVIHQKMKEQSKMYAKY